MKLAVAKAAQVPDWTPLRTDDLHPAEIRRLLVALLDRESKGGAEYHFVTLNRTALDFVRDREETRLSYEDVSVWRDGKLVPLVTIHHPDWLAAFQLGDLLEHGDLIPET